MAASFKDLWKQHPFVRDGEMDPCSGRHIHGNQCGIRLGLAFQRNGIDMATFQGLFCFNSHGRQHPIRAREIGKWLSKEQRTWGEAEVHRRVRKTPISLGNFTGKTGILLCTRFRGIDNPDRSFNHIDLWDGNRAADARFAAGFDAWITRAKEVHFWEVR